MTSPKTNQLNIRVDRELEMALDQKRIELSRELGYIPSRSEIIRMAMETFLGIAVTKPTISKKQ